MDKKKTSIRSIIEPLEIGRTATFPLSRINVVRTTTYNYSLATGKRFRTRSNRESRTLVVTRIE